MEIIRPEAVRLANGIELYITNDEACRPFVTPSEEERFQTLLSESHPVQAMILERHRLDAMTSYPHHEWRTLYPWVRYPQE